MPTKYKADNCSKYASYVDPDTKKLTHCATHKTPNMINPRKDSRACKHPDHGPDNPAPRASFNFIGCKPLYCKAHAEPEMINVNSLKENNISFIHNKSVGFVCGNYRPDIKIDAGTHFVIVEVDEDQHRQYDSSCEIVRMLNIYQAEGMRCVFLRYNPDVFRDENGITYPFKNFIRTGTIAHEYRSG